MARDNPSDNPSDFSSKRAPRLSVLMPLYNGERFLSAAIESALSQTFSDFELLVVDDGSSDGSAEIVRSFGARDSRIRGIFLRKNVGIATAMNMGLRAARAPLLARLDCDDYCAPDRFAEQVSYMDKHADIYMLGSRAINIDEDDNMLANVGKYKFIFAIGRRRISSHIGRGEYPLLHPALMYRTATVLALGGYREVFPIAEDDDLYERMFVRYGCVFANLSRSLYFYRRSPGSLSFTGGKYSSKKRRYLSALISYSSECFVQDLPDPLAVVKYLPFSPLRRSKDEFIIMEIVFYLYMYRMLLYKLVPYPSNLRVPAKNLRRFSMLMSRLSLLPNGSKTREFLYRRIFLLLLSVVPKDKDERVDFLANFDDALFNRDVFFASADYCNRCIVVARGCFSFGEWNNFMRYMFMAFRIDFVYTLRFIFVRLLAHLWK